MDANNVVKRVKRDCRLELAGSSDPLQQEDHKAPAALYMPICPWKIVYVQHLIHNMANSSFLLDQCAEIKGL